MSWAVGTEVIAVSHADDKTVWWFGRGAYMGDLPRPDMELTDVTRKLIEAHILHEDERPIEEHDYVQWHDTLVARGKVPSDQGVEIRAKIIADLRADRALPLEERVQKWFDEMRKNPCIHLRNGWVVWGYQCWWGPKDSVKRQFKDHEWVEVPVPEGNERWKD